LDLLLKLHDSLIFVDDVVLEVLVFHLSILEFLF